MAERITSHERLDRMVGSILDAIEAGDDPAPLVDRLGKAQPWLMVQAAQEAAEESFQRTRTEDERIEPSQQPG